MREEEDRQIIFGSVVDAAEDSYTELASAPIHTAVTVGQNTYPRVDNTRLGLNKIAGRTVVDNDALVPCVVSGWSVTGFNQWDEVAESGAINSSTGETKPNAVRIRSKNFIPVIGGSDYYFCSPKDLEIFQYDADGNYIGALADGHNVMRTLAENCAYLKIVIYSTYGTTYNHDICINLSKTTGTPQNGEYLPYQSAALSVPSTTLNGVGSAQDYIEAVEVAENDYSLILHRLVETSGNEVVPLATPTETTIAEHLTLAQVSAVAQNGGVISVVNSNGDIVQPDLTVNTVTSRSAS